MGSARQVYQRRELGFDSEDTGTAWGLEPTRNILTVFTLTVGSRIDCRGVGTKTETYYCSNLGKRSGGAGSREWVEFYMFCFLNLVLEQN